MSSVEFRSIRGLHEPQDSEFVSLRQSPRQSLFASPHEEVAMLSNARLIKEADLDIIHVIAVAEKAGLISRNTRRVLCRKFRDTDSTPENEANIRLVLEMIRRTSVGDVVILLKLVGLNDLAWTLEASVYHQHKISEIGSSEIVNANDVSKFYFNWKGFLDNDIYEDRVGALDRMSNQLELGMTQDAHGQRSADRFAIIRFLYMNNVDDAMERERILSRMREVVPANLDHSLVDIVYTGCAGWSAQMNGDFERAFDMTRKLQALVALVSHPVVKCVLCNLAEGIYRRLALENADNTEYKRQCIFYCDQGLQLCQGFEESDSVKHRRLLVMSVCYVLLGIRQDLTVNHNLPDRKSQMLAKEYLEGMRKSLFKDIESRRRVKYHLCIARLNEADDTELALDYARRCLGDAEGTHYSPEQVANITEYKNRLEARVAMLD